jgi:hypothetical protein
VVVVVVVVVGGARRGNKRWKRWKCWIFALLLLLLVLLLFLLRVRWCGISRGSLNLVVVLRRSGGDLLGLLYGQLLFYRHRQRR